MQYFQMILDFMNNILNVFSKENDDMIKDSLNELKKSIEAHYKIKFNLNLILMINIFIIFYLKIADIIAI